MTDDFLSNNNYYNKGGLNGKPEEPRPIPPNGQSSDRKEIILEFSNGYCLVLENNEISIRENGFTKLCIEFGKRTNELLEFVKELYLDKKAKEQECEKLNSDKRYFVNQIMALGLLTDEYEQALKEIEDIADDYNRVEKNFTIL